MLHNPHIITTKSTMSPSSQITAITWITMTMAVAVHHKPVLFTCRSRLCEATVVLLRSTGHRNPSPCSSLFRHLYATLLFAVPEPELLSSVKNPDPITQLTLPHSFMPPQIQARIRSSLAPSSSPETHFSISTAIPIKATTWRLGSGKSMSAAV
ncbi:hypothetical protein M0R45_017107 [Rubus argutus]|uniref:Uncharacterized protein n=1 Tax=Rubus argutus TaxID=59490 RepID=A0AAW1XUN8_RUBAR